MHFLGDVFIQEEPLSFIAGCFSLGTLLGPFSGEDIWGERQGNKEGPSGEGGMDSGRGILNDCLLSYLPCQLIPSLSYNLLRK